MPIFRARWCWLALVLCLAPWVALGGAAKPEPRPEPTPPRGPEDREVPPERGHIYMLDKEFQLCLKHLRSSRTPLAKRVEAVGAFALTRDHRVVPLFVKMISREDQVPIELRVAIVWALGEIGDPRGLPALQYVLYQIFLDNPAWRYDKGIHVQTEGKPRTISLQEMVTGQLARLGEMRVSAWVDEEGKRHRGFVEFVLEPLEGVTEGADPKADKRRAALLTLAAVGDGDGRAVQALCAVLRADDKYYPWDFKIIAARALSDIVRTRREAFQHVEAQDKLLDEIAKAFIEGAAVTDVAEVREIVGWSLRKMGWADRAGRQLAIVLESPALPKDSRYRIIQALAFIRSKEAADTLILELANPDENVRWRAAVALGATGHPEPATAVRFLGRLTTNPPEESTKVRMKACAGLGHLEDPRGIPHLAVAMDDREPQVRVQAAIALGRIGNRAAIPALVDRGLHDPSIRVRGMSVVALGDLGREEGLKHVARLLADPESRDPSPAVRVVAARVLDQFLNPWATKALIAALGDEDKQVRQAATTAMKSRLARRAKSTLPLLVETITTGQGSARAAALRCVMADYRSPKTLNNPKRRAFYDRQLGDPDSPMAAALLAVVEDTKAHGEARALAATFLTELAWRRRQKGREILARIAALTRDPNADVRAAARSARNYLNNLP
ncbi:MAG: HEAT repeat domain-containing protein [Planctomycetota bacterium]